MRVCFVCCTPARALWRPASDLHFIGNVFLALFDGCSPFLRLIQGDASDRRHDTVTGVHLGNIVLLFFIFRFLAVHFTIKNMAEMSTWVVSVPSASPSCLSRFLWLSYPMSRLRESTRNSLRERTRAHAGAGRFHSEGRWAWSESLQVRGRESVLKSGAYERILSPFLSRSI